VSASFGAFAGHACSFPEPWRVRMTLPRCPTGPSEITSEVGDRDIDGKIEGFVSKQIPLAC
jgi:hypothetical protein